MCDGAVYIRNAANKMWPQVVIALYQFHFWQAIKPKFYNSELIPKIQNNVNVIKFRDFFTPFENSKIRYQ